MTPLLARRVRDETALTQGVDNSLADDLATLFRVFVSVMSKIDLDFFLLPSYKG